MGVATKIEWCDRLLAKVDRRGPNECWPWLGAMTSKGYGVFSIGGSNTTAHRAAYTLAVSDPGPLQVDHMCRNRACCNPSHLEAVTNAENTRRGLRGSLPTHCKRGHEWGPGNTGTNTSGRRVCMDCRRARDRGRRDAAYWRAYRSRRKDSAHG